MALTKTPIELSSTPSIVDGGNATAITIDSSENVMVNRTSVFTTAKMEIQSDAGDASTLALNSIDTDGSILEFYKAGTAVGSIAVASGNNLAIDGLVASHAGLEFGTGRITPRVAGATADNAVDLGYSTQRFQDLYLSGGAYLGGTAAANKLEHYEEVAWTPTQAGVTLSVTKARAIRVGNLVTLNARISWPSNTDSTTIAVGGLPFTFVSTWEGTGSIMANNVYLDSNRTQLSTYLGGSSINFYKTGSGVSWNALNNTSLSAAEVIFTVSYLTS